MRYELQDLGRRFVGSTGDAVVALDGLTLGIEPGERVAFIGPSGSGKSTLLRLLNGLLRPTSGRLLIDGAPLFAQSGRQLRAMRRQTGMVHQHLALVPPLRAIDNVLLGKLGEWPVWKGLLIRACPPRAEVTRAREILKSLGIGEKWEATTRALSGGEQQRVAIARLLFQAPAVMLLDEPVSALDPGFGAEAIERLIAAAQGSGRTLVASLHDVELARAYFPRIIGLHGGRLAFDRPSRAVTDALLTSLYQGSLFLHG